MSLSAPASDAGQRASVGGRWPDFILIGAMKSGTTTLDQHLRRHPGVFMCEPKEPQYFSREEILARGEAWYRGLFASAREDQLCGEASACYSRYPHFPDVPERIRGAAPNVKLLYIIRHPVERAYSHYAHRLLEKRLTDPNYERTFEEMLAETEELVDTSLYLKQIERYLAQFPRERLLVLLLDDLEADASVVLRQVCAFLELPHEPFGEAEAIVANESGWRLARRRARERLRAIRRAPVISQCVDALPASWRRDGFRWLHKGLARSFVGKRISADQNARKSPLTDETRRMLLERFAAPTRELEGFLERKLPQWFV